MNWRQFQQVQMYRLLIRLRRQRRFYEGVQAFLVKYGFPPSDPLRYDNERMLKETADYIADVQTMMFQLAPYRPLADPYTTRGLASHHLPDFKLRGIMTRPEGPIVPPPD